VMRERVVLVRFGELALKGNNRDVFLNILVSRIRQSMRGLEGWRVIPTHGRVLIEHEGDSAPIVAAAKRVFGVVSVSPAIRVPVELEAMRAAALKAVQEHLSAHPELAAQGRIPFRVSASRAGRNYPWTSQELNQLLGEYILPRVQGLQVNLNHPQLELFCEVRHGSAFLFTEVISGPGGLPYGSGGKAMLLLSGGIDSPVAGWMAMKRGVTIEAIHFHSYPFTSQRALEKVKDLCKVLAQWSGGPVKLHTVSATEIQKEIRMHCPESLSITLLRRFMARIAERLAEREGALALVTGESLGQVASQTMESLYTIENVTRIPILRPLIAMDKTEIIALARQIGTYELSILPYEDCCSLFAPKNPKTRPKVYQAEQAEAALDVNGLIEAASRGCRRS
jgi:thiamine biosynthesis protein ThiI